MAKQKRREKMDSRTLSRVVQAFAPYKFQVILVLFAIIVTTVLGLVNPFMISFVFDDAIGKRNGGLLIILVLIMCAVPIITGLIGVGQTYLNNLIGQSVMRDLRNKLYHHLQSMSLRFFTSTRTGEIQSRLANDVDGVQDIVTNTAAGIVANISTVLSTVIGLLLLSPLLTFISLGLLPIFIWVTYKVGNVRRRTSKETQESMASLTAIAQETLSVSGILLIKTFHRTKYFQKRFEKENQRLTDLEVRQQLIGRWFFMFIGIFFAVMPAIVYLIGGLQIIDNPVNPPITLGMIVAFTTLQARLFAPIGQLLSVQVEIQGAFALFDRIFEYLDMPIEIQDKANALHLKPEEVRGRVVFKAVSFTYKSDFPAGPGNSITPANSDLENSEALTSPFPSVHITSAHMAAVHVDPCIPVRRGRMPRPVVLEPLREPSEAVPRATLKKISFEVEPGQLVALVGPSGAGKTTTTYLVPRLYDVASGAVEIDGHNVKDLTLASLSEIVGMVTQETYLFHTSIRENLLFAREDATEEEMIAATKAAAIHERIMELEDGYDTVVGERGFRLSGGEKQRIAIARVLLKSPRILILDEATSALDTHSERLIQTALKPLMKGRTTLAIAHRLSTILAADLILVFEKGEIIERGTHEELLRQNGIYAQLYHEQFMKDMIEESLSEKVPSGPASVSQQR